MARVVGIGGIFFKAADPEAVAAWYRRVLGFDVQDWGGAMFPPLPHGHTVWSPFKASTDYFAPSAAPFMVNLMVEDLDGVLARIEAEGETVLGRSDDDPSGRFAWLLDPTGVKLELWEPAPET